MKELEHIKNFDKKMYKYAGTTAVSGCIVYVDDIKPNKTEDADIKTINPKNI